MPCGGSGSGVAEGAGAETDARLTGAEAFGLAVEIDAVCVGAKSSINACTGAETGAGLTVPERLNWPSQSIRFASELRPRQTAWS